MKQLRESNATCADQNKTASSLGAFLHLCQQNLQTLSSAKSLDRILQLQTEIVFKNKSFSFTYLDANANIKL